MLDAWGTGYQSCCTGTGTGTCEKVLVAKTKSFSAVIDHTMSKPCGYGALPALDLPLQSQFGKICLVEFWPRLAYAAADGENWNAGRYRTGPCVSSFCIPIASHVHRSSAQWGCQGRASARPALVQLRTWCFLCHPLNSGVESAHLHRASWWFPGYHQHSVSTTCSPRIWAANGD